MTKELYTTTEELLMLRALVYKYVPVQIYDPCYLWMELRGFNEPAPIKELEFMIPILKNNDEGGI